MESISIKKEWFTITLALLLPLFLLAQQKKSLTEDDYEKWHTLSTGPISPDGNWVSYSMLYKNGNDTLFLKNSVKEKLLSFPKAHSPVMSKDGNFFLCISNDTLKITGIRKKSGYTIPNLASYTLHGNILLGILKGSQGRTLLVHRLGSHNEKIIENITEYSIDNLYNYLVFIRDQKDSTTLEIMEPKVSFKSRILDKTSEHSFKGLTWNKAGKAFALYYTDSKNTYNDICIYRQGNTNSEFRSVKMEAAEHSPEVRLMGTPLFVSDDANKVFFDVSLTNDRKKNTPDVSIFRNTDLTIPPKIDNKKLWHVWHVKTDSIRALEDSHFPTAFLTGNQKYAVMYNDTRYLPLHNFDGYYMDMYIMDIETGKKELLVEKQMYEYQHLLVSPKGKYIAYFKEREWWLYDVEKKRAKKINGGPNTPFYNAENDYPQDETYGIAGWTKNDEQVIIYDRYDIWLAPCSDGQMQRITHGKEEKITYRIYDDGIYPLVRESFFGFTSKELDLQSGLVIIGVDNDDYTNSLCLYKYSKFNIIDKNCAAISAVVKAEKDDAIYFLESSFSMSPQYMRASVKERKTVLVRSNKQQDKYFWGTAKLISFDAVGKKGLKGALFYPADYNPEKSYPMVVNIYQKKSLELNKYVEPSLQINSGFNVTNFTSKGYFVLMPDIHFIMGSPGKSALECVIAATASAVSSANIDTSKIALMGHSFGGFETTYIVSQTNIFKTAVAGAAVTDLMGMYLDIDAYGKSNMERFNNGQFRNKSSFNSATFSAESPLLNVATINTPILLYAGKEDRLVLTEHTLRLHTALWNLGKVSNLLLYPREQHTIEESGHQADLYHKVMDWMDYYLKDGEFPKWLK
jgi:dipeptidyl aminopeptidase/acylaminoacyl peptidase